MNRETISKTIYTETAHRLPEYEGLCKHLHGHSYKWQLSISYLRENHLIPHSGMMIDFALMKKVLEATIKRFDHALVVKYNDVLVENHLSGDRELIPYEVTPFCERVVLLEEAPTAENMVAYLLPRIKSVLLQELKGTLLIGAEMTLSVNETVTSHYEKTIKLED